jgi:transposase
MKTTSNKKQEKNMSTTNIVVEIRPYSLTELSRLYGISNGIMKRWLAPHTEIIGEKVGRFYNALQVKTIFEKLGLPGKAEE